MAAELSRRAQGCAQEIHRRCTGWQAWLIFALRSYCSQTKLFELFRHATVTGQTKQYVIQTLGNTKPSFIARLRVFLGIFAFALLVQWILDRFVFHKHYDLSLLLAWIQILIMPTVLAAHYALRPQPIFGRSSLLILGDDFIERIMSTRYYRFKKRIERDRVRSVSEISKVRMGTDIRGLVVRDRGKFGAWFCGYVYVPSTVDDYESIKAKLLSWIPSVA